MNRPKLTSLGAALTVAAVTLAGGSALADPWAKDKGKDCDNGAFKAPGDAAVDDLVLCSKLWVAYRTDLKPVKGDYKDRVVTAMKRLWVKGEEADADRAKLILSKLGVSDLPERNAAPPKPKAPPRKAFNPPAPSKGDIKKAEREFKKGFKAYKKKDFAGAAAAYEKMVDAAPGYAKGHFNAACAYALLKDEGHMAKYLLNLRDMANADDADAKKMLELVKTDGDFAEIRDTSPSYKRITGYAKFMVINDLGDKGEENVDYLVDSLKKLGYKPETKDSDKRPLKRPFIFYSADARRQAYIAKKLIKHPKVVTKQMPQEKLCGDDGCFDVVIQWSDDIKKDDEPKAWVADPDDAEDKLDALEKEQDELLSKPDEALDEVDDALGKPEEVQERIEDNLERPGKAIDKVEKTIDKLKNPF